MANRIVAKNLNVRETEALVRKHQEETSSKPQQQAKTTIDPDIANLQERVTQSIGAQTQIKHSEKGSGKLIISYDTLEQLEGVLERLG